MLAGPVGCRVRSAVGGPALCGPRGEGACLPLSRVPGSLRARPCRCIVSPPSRSRQRTRFRDFHPSPPTTTPAQLECSGPAAVSFASYPILPRPSSTGPAGRAGHADSCKPWPAIGDPTGIIIIMMCIEIINKASSLCRGVGSNGHDQTRGRGGGQRSTNRQGLRPRGQARAVRAGARGGGPRCGPRRRSGP